MEKEFSGYMVLFGPKPGQKLDPRFPVPVTICYPDGKEIHYISENKNAEEVRAIRLALHQIAEGPEIRLIPEMKSKLAQAEYVAAWSQRMAKAALGRE